MVGSSTCRPTVGRQVKVRHRNCMIYDTENNGESLLSMRFLCMGMGRESCCRKNQAGAVMYFVKLTLYQTRREFFMMRKVALFSALVFALSVMGCAKPPQMELDAAKQAVDAAKQSEAEKYAPETLKAAQDSLEAANSETERQNGRIFFLRNYDQAKSSALAASSVAAKAKEEAIAEKARRKQEAETAVAAAQTAIDSAKVALEHAPTGKGSEVDINQMKADVAAAETQLGEAKSAVTGEDFDGAKSKATAVKSTADRVAGDVKAAAEKVAALKAAKKGAKRGKQ